MTDFEEKVVQQMANARKETEMFRKFAPLEAKVIHVRVDKLHPNYELVELEDMESTLKLVEATDEFEINFPVIIDADMNIIAGNAKFWVAKWLNLVEIPTVQVSLLTESELFGFSCVAIKIAQELCLEWEFLRLELVELVSIGL